MPLASCGSDMLMRIVAERKRREIAPTIAALGELAARIHDFLRALSSWYEQVRGLSKPPLVTLKKIGGRPASLIPSKKE